MSLIDKAFASSAILCIAVVIGTGPYVGLTSADVPLQFLGGAILGLCALWSSWGIRMVWSQ